MKNLLVKCEQVRLVKESNSIEIDFLPVDLRMRNHLRTLITVTGTEKDKNHFLPGNLYRLTLTSIYK